MTLYERTKRHLEDMGTALAENKFGTKASCQLEDEDGTLLLKLYKEDCNTILKFRYEEFELTSEGDSIEDNFEFIKNDAIWQEHVSCYNEGNMIAFRLEPYFKYLCLLHMQEYIANSICMTVDEKQDGCEAEDEILSVGEGTEGHTRLFVLVEAWKYRIKALGLEPFIAIAK